MKSIFEVKERLKAARKELKDVQKRFEKYDNHDDMDMLPVIAEEIRTLEWVLTAGGTNEEVSKERTRRTERGGSRLR